MGRTLNVNVGILGHVDSGKTMLAKVLSTVSSTAAFDKSPQSITRGITLDLGFSAFHTSAPIELREKYDTVQYTLVDCPGHASLIRTVIGGAQIIDLVLLVVDATKGFQTQTSECLVLAQILKKQLVVVLNKIDLCTDEQQQKMTKKIRSCLVGTGFDDCAIVCTSAKNSQVEQLVTELSANVNDPHVIDSGFLFLVDHCFSVKGHGTIFTGTVLSGSALIGDSVSIPALNCERKIKSIQVFKTAVDSISAGDRAGICLGNFETFSFERGIVCAQGQTARILWCIAKVRAVKYFRNLIESKQKFHISIANETAIAECRFFRCQNYATGSLVKLEPFLQEGDDWFCVFEFERELIVPLGCQILASRLDFDLGDKSCRFAFYGEPDLALTAGSTVKQINFFKEKTRVGEIERQLDGFTLICKNMFPKESNMEKFTGLPVRLQSGSIGRLAGPFGKSGKCRITFSSEIVLIVGEPAELRYRSVNGQIKLESGM